MMASRRGRPSWLPSTRSIGRRSMSGRSRGFGSRGRVDSRAIEFCRCFRRWPGSQFKNQARANESTCGVGSFVAWKACVMDLSVEDLAFARTVFDGLVEEFVRWGRPLPLSVSRARRILDRALSSVMSLERQEIEAEGGQSNSGNIGSSEAAELLGVTRRTVQRNAELLGGQRVSGSWVFDVNDIGA